MSDVPPVVYVDLLKSSVRRRQPWRWVAKSAGNQRKLATSGEWYTNRTDALAAIRLVFGAGSTVFVREFESGNELLRAAVTQ